MSNTYGHYELDNASPCLAGEAFLAGQVVAHTGLVRVVGNGTQAQGAEAMPYGISVYDAEEGKRVDVAIDGIVNVLVKGTPGPVTIGGPLFAVLNGRVSSSPLGGDMSVVMGQALAALPADTDGIIPIRLSVSYLILGG